MVIETAERERLTVLILQDVFDGIVHFHGTEALDQIAEFARAKNRARESNELIDKLEAEYGL